MNINEMCFAFHVECVIIILDFENIYLMKHAINVIFNFLVFDHFELCHIDLYK